RYVLLEDPGPGAADVLAWVELRVRFPGENVELVGGTEQRNDRRVWVVHLEHDRVLVRRADVRYRRRLVGVVVGQRAGTRVVLDVFVPRPHDVFRVHDAVVGRRPAVELHVLAQLERERQLIRAELPGLRAL